MKAELFVEKGNFRLIRCLEIEPEGQIIFLDVATDRLKVGELT
jgi:hypothetical protein